MKQLMKLRKPLKITSRTSTVTNCFVQAIIPSIEPTPEEYDEALAILGMTRDKLSCVYCGGRATDFDHLRPLVKDKRPTGYINEIRNCVPSCAPCNQSKSGADWRVWMEGDARGSPKMKGIPDLAQRIDRIARFETWANVQPVLVNRFVSDGDWRKHWENLAAIEDMMKRAQEHAAHVRSCIMEAIEAERRRDEKAIELNSEVDNGQADGQSLLLARSLT